MHAVVQILTIDVQELVALRRNDKVYCVIDNVKRTAVIYLSAYSTPYVVNFPEDLTILPFF